MEGDHFTASVRPVGWELHGQRFHDYKVGYLNSDYHGVLVPGVYVLEVCIRKEHGRERRRNITDNPLVPLPHHTVHHHHKHNDLHIIPGEDPTAGTAPHRTYDNAMIQP
ncbi:hypothetical protein VNO80_03703 [Phaseolus coccineus]|uniref:Uncharacterized protein n=1 Tax=Phaseolus coccineus TaxID=3886 RepID=A0AAN9NTN9_PHACN